MVMAMIQRRVTPAVAAMMAKIQLGGREEDNSAGRGNTALAEVTELEFPIVTKIYNFNTQDFMSLHVANGPKFVVYLAISIYASFVAKDL